MIKYSKKELEEALKSLNSTLSKCEKALPKLKEGSAQHTLMVRRINSFRIAIVLVEKELE
jgi:hypothetical protein